MKTPHPTYSPLLNGMLWRKASGTSLGEIAVLPLPTVPSKGLGVAQCTVTSARSTRPSQKLGGSGATRRSPHDRVRLFPPKIWGGVVYGYFCVAGSNPALGGSPGSSESVEQGLMPCATYSPRLNCRGGRGRLLRFVSERSVVQIHPYVQSGVRSSAWIERFGPARGLSVVACSRQQQWRGGSCRLLLWLKPLASPAGAEQVPAGSNPAVPHNPMAHVPALQRGEEMK